MSVNSNTRKKHVEFSFKLEEDKFGKNYVLKYFKYTKEESRRYILEHIEVSLSAWLERKHEEGHLEV